MSQEKNWSSLIREKKTKKGEKFEVIWNGEPMGLKQMLELIHCFVFSIKE